MKKLLLTLLLTFCTSFIQATTKTVDLMKAIEQHNRFEINKLLNDPSSNIDFTYQDPAGKTLLFKAIENRKESEDLLTIKELLKRENKISPFLVDKNTRMTALHKACNERKFLSINNDEELLYLLIKNLKKHKKNPNEMDYHRETPFSLACNDPFMGSSFIRIYSRLYSAKKNAPDELVNFNNGIPVVNALLNGNTDLATALLRSCKEESLKRIQNFINAKPHCSDEKFENTLNHYLTKIIKQKDTQNSSYKSDNESDGLSSVPEEFLAHETV